LSIEFDWKATEAFQMFWKNSGRFVAVYQLASAVAFGFTFSLTALSEPQTLTLVALAGLFFINLIAGLLLYRDSLIGNWTSLANMSAQVIAIEASEFSYVYIGMANARFFAYIDPSTSTYLFGPALVFQPGTFGVSVGQLAQATQISVDFVSLSLVMFLIQSIRRVGLSATPV
jgi:hypothetical protein